MARRQNAAPENPLFDHATLHRRQHSQPLECTTDTAHIEAPYRLVQRSGHRAQRWVGELFGQPVEGRDQFPQFIEGGVALQAMENRGTLAIDTVRNEDAVPLTISDTGPGIPAELSARIFEPFFTTKASVLLHFDPQRICIVVEDHGHGFDTDRPTLRRVE